MKKMPQRKEAGPGRFARGAFCFALSVAIIAAFGCARDGGTALGDRMPEETGDRGGLGMRSVPDGPNVRLPDDGRGAGVGATGDDGQQDGIIRLSRKNGELYVPLQRLAEMLEFKTSHDPETGTYRIGDNDVAFELKAGSGKASRYGDPVTLDKPVVSMNGELYVPLDAIKTLFADVFEYEVDGEALRLKPQEEPADDAGLPDFKDDPYDPFTNASDAKESAAPPADVPVDAKLKNIDVNALIKTAHEYIGVPYVFGAKPYPQSKVFDCSSYVQYVYGKYGVDLPRTSRKQAQVGKAVSRTELRKGDLLFFYLPGRYKSNNIVGHVGIYIGNGKMIHSSNKPKDGVQVTSINKPFWKKTYLSARRVVQ